MSELVIKTNNVPREIIDGTELPVSERLLFPYIDWQAIDAGETGASFFRYKGEVYDLAEIQYLDPTYNMGKKFPNWQGYQSDSFFSGILVRYFDNNGHWLEDAVIVGRYYC